MQEFKTVFKIFYPETITEGFKVRAHFIELELNKKYTELNKKYA